MKKAQITIDATNKHEDDETKSDHEDDIIKRVQVRPKTPVFKDLSGLKKVELEHNDKRQKAVILLQRLLRGRAK